MTDLTVQRTLVKSPPELWSELSEVEGLARHLGEFGEIRITRAAPETTVAWEGEHASGTVEIEPAGWGTKVTLTAAVAEPEAAAAEKPAAAEPAAAKPAEPDPVETAESHPAAAEPERLSDELDRIAERAQDSYWDDLVHWGERDDEDGAPPPKPRRNRFARLFRRRSRGGTVGDEAIVAERVEPEAAPPEPAAVEVAEPKPAPAEPVAPEPAEPVAPEPVATKPLAPAPAPAPTAVEPEAPAPLEAPTIAPDHARAVLEHALDNLGAAHHRPFSRG